MTVEVPPFVNNRIIYLKLHNPLDEVVFQTFEEELTFALFSKLELLTSLSLIDCPNMSTAQVLSNDNQEAFDRLSEQYHARWLLSGSLMPQLQSGHIQQLSITLRLVDLQEHQLVVDRQFTLNQFQNSPEGLNIPVDVFNTLINQLAAEVARVTQARNWHRLESEIYGHQVCKVYRALKLAARAERRKAPTLEKIQAFDSAVGLDPSMEWVQFQLGKLYKLTRQFSKSVLHFKKTIEVSTAPQATRATYAVEAGISSALLGQSNLAIQWWKKAIDFDPELLNPYLNIALKLEEHEDYSQALEFLLAAQKHHEMDSRLIATTARIYSRKMAWQEAITQYQLLLALDPHDAWCHNDIALCFLQLGDNTQATYHMQKAMDLGIDGEAADYAKLILGQLTGSTTA
jgi:tetratricopeptide (TPR) repeat protein